MHCSAATICHKTAQLSRSLLSVCLPSVFAHRVSTHFDPMRVVHKSIEDTVGGRWIADLFVPARHRKLRSQDCGAHLVAVFADLPEVAALGFCERSHGPVVDDEDIDSAEPRK